MMNKPTEHIIHVTSKNIFLTTSADRRYRDALHALSALTPEQAMTEGGVYQTAIDKVEEAYREANQLPD